MGYSPGEFTACVAGEVTTLHWELKDGGRVILWNADESKKIFEMEAGPAMFASRQLDLLVDMS